MHPFSCEVHPRQILPLPVLQPKDKEVCSPQEHPHHSSHPYALLPKQQFRTNLPSPNHPQNLDVLLIQRVTRLPSSKKKYRFNLLSETAFSSIKLNKDKGQSTHPI
jgi:hypothetical protein